MRGNCVFLIFSSANKRHRNVDADNLLETQAPHTRRQRCNFYELENNLIS